MQTRFQVRAIPVGLAIQLSRRLLALDHRVTVRSIHELVARWWEYGAAGWDALTRDGIVRPHPLDFAIEELERERDAAA
jgi:hypothetical protein